MSKPVSNPEWEWRDTETSVNHAVRLFADTQRLIWSSWMDSPDPAEPPVYGDGLVQTFVQFLANGAPSSAVLPNGFIEPLRTEVQSLLPK